MRDELVISRGELATMLEYSCSLPTGTTIGKRWRCQARYRDPNSDWLIGEYVPDLFPDSGMVGIKWYWAVSEPGSVHSGPLR